MSQAIEIKLDRCVDGSWIVEATSIDLKTTAYGCSNHSDMLELIERLAWGEEKPGSVTAVDGISRETASARREPPKADEWIPWDVHGPAELPPISGHERVMIRTRGGGEAGPGRHDNFVWDAMPHQPHLEIIAYKIIGADA